MTKTINDVYMQLFRRLKEGGDPMPQLTAREITAYACKADKKQTAGWSHFYVEDTTVDYAGLLCDRCLDGEPLAYIIGEWDFYGLTFQVGGASITLTSLAIAAIAGIALNAILPGNDFHFGKTATSDTAASLGRY